MVNHLNGENLTHAKKRVYSKNLMGRMNAESIALGLSKLFLNYVLMVYLKSSRRTASKP